MISDEKLEKMEDGKDKELLKLVKEKGKPYKATHDGYAFKVEEDKELKYKDYEGQELTMKVPKGSYVVWEDGSYCPKVMTAEQFEHSNKFCDDVKPKKESESGSGEDKKEIKIGLETLAE